MAILSYGTLAGDVESYLSLKKAVDVATPEGTQQELIIVAIESLMKRWTGRNFEQTTYTSEFHDVQEAQREFWLSDRPVTTFTSVVRVDTLDANGDPDTTTTVDADQYAKKLTSGRIVKRSGYWREGIQRYQLTYTAGYTTAELAAVADEEINLWKLLSLQLIAREYGMAKENRTHLVRISYAEESTEFFRSLSPLQRDMLEDLSLKRKTVSE